MASAQRKKINELHASLLEDEANEPKTAKVLQLIKEAERLQNQNAFLRSQNRNVFHYFFSVFLIYYKQRMRTIIEYVRKYEIISIGPRKQMIV